MTDTANNPKGAGFGNFINNGAFLQQYVADEPLMRGDLVDLDLYSGPGTTNPPDVPTVAPSPLTPTGRTIGVVVGGDIDGTGVVPEGGVATVMTLGVVQVICDATTVAGDPLVQSPATLGAAQTASSPTTRTVGVALQSVTIDSGTAPVWALINPGTEGGSGGGSTFPTFTGSGSPLGTQTATTGQSYQDTATGAMYLYYGLTSGNTDWTLLGGGAGGTGVGGVGVDTSNDLFIQSLASVVIEAQTDIGIGSGTGFGLEIAAGGSDAFIGLLPGDNSIIKADDGFSLQFGVGSGQTTLNVHVDGVSTAPTVDSATATTSLGQPAIGTPLQNTTDYDVLYSVVIPITAATGGYLTMGVGASSPPTTDAASPAITGAANITLSGILPAGYFLLIGDSGTITPGTPVAVFTPL